MTARTLPQLMVAPNGARRSKADHPAIPIEVGELVETAVACQNAGADGIHVHVRDSDGNHSIDVGQYREALAAIKHAAPDLFLQVTSEAAGRFSPEEQMAMIRELQPSSVSLAYSELMRPPTDTETARAFYAWARDAGVTIHHIAYTPDQLLVLLTAIHNGIIPGTDHQLQLVLGSYAGTEPSRPSDLDAYQLLMDGQKDKLVLDWMICAFGSQETPCLVETARRGGKLRVGFENSLWNADGSLAKDNAQRVAEVRAALLAAGLDRDPKDGL